MKKIYFFASLIFVLSFSTAQNIDSFVNLVSDINPGSSNGTPTSLTEFNGEVLFRANDGVNGLELWKLDSNLNVSLVQDIRPGSDSSTPNNLIVYNGKLYFTAFDENVGGVDLFSYDGTSVSSESLYGSSFSGLFNPIELDGKLYYTGFNSIVQPNRLIEFDGTTGDEVPDVGAGEEAILGGNTIAFNGKILLYMNYSTDDATVGTELYEYDPTAQTFTLIKDIDPGPDNSSIGDFVQLGNEVYFEAEGQVWKTDGTTAGTVLVSAVDNLNIDNVRSFFVWNDELYFEGDNGVDGDELYKYKPSSDAVVALSSISGANDNHDPDDFIIVSTPLIPNAEALVYSGEPGTDNDARLFLSDGSSIFQLTEEYVDVTEIFYWPGQEFILFRADELDANGDEIFGSELYVYDLNALSVENQELTDVSIYPNPVENNIFIQSTRTFEDYSIFDLNGRNVQSGILDSGKIETSLSSGVYILNLNSGDTVSQHKIIIK
jgi:ELWxxDGT repeat protein